MGHIQFACCVILKWYVAARKWYGMTTVDPRFEVEHPPRLRLQMAAGNHCSAEFGHRVYFILDRCGIVMWNTRYGSKPFFELGSSPNVGKPAKSGLFTL